MNEQRGVIEFGMLRVDSDDMESVSKNLVAEDKMIEASEAVTEAVLDMFVNGMLTQADLSKIYKHLSEWTSLGIQIIESVSKTNNNLTRGNR